METSGRATQIEKQRQSLMTVKEYAHVTREHPLSVYRRIREGRQPGVFRLGTAIRLTPPTEE